MQTRFACPVCGATAWERTALHYYASADETRPKLSAYQALRRRVLFEVWLPQSDDALPGKRRLAAVVCRSCGYGSAAPRPDAVDVAAKYEFLVAVEGSSGASAHDAEGQASDAQRAQRTADALVPHIPSDRRSVLDVGGGDGKLLAPFRAAGIETFLVDYNPNPLPGVVRLGATLEDLPSERTFGAAVLSHVLEHAAEPLELLSATRRHLAPNGVIYVEVPSEHWTGLPIAVDPVTHVGFFTPAALDVVVRRAGFEIVELHEGPGSYGGATKGVITLVARAGDVAADVSPTLGAGDDALRRVQPSRRSALVKNRNAGRRRPPVRTLLRGVRRVSPAPLIVMTDVYPKISETFIINELRALERLGQPVAVEATARPTESLPLDATDPTAHYASDDGRRIRWRATAWLALRHPLGVAADLVSRRAWQREEDVARLRVLAPVAWRIARSGTSHLHVHFAAQASLNALRIGRLLGLPWSVTAHAYEIFMKPANLGEKLSTARFATTGCDYNVAYLESLLPAGERRVHKIVMGVDPTKFTRSSPPANGRNVIAVGRLVEKKGFAYLIDAVGILRDRGEPVSLTIIGDGALRDELAATAARAGVTADVRFAGALQQDEVQAELERADVLVCPCVVAANGDRDSMPVVVKEAMAMELPVIGTQEVGLPEMIGPDRGRLVPPADADALADAISEVLTLPPAARAALGAAGRAWVGACADVVTETRKLLALLRSEG